MNAEENLADSHGAIVCTDVDEWEDMINCTGKREMFTGVCGTQDSIQDIIEIDIF
jgi:hypothetical protein